MGFFDFLSRTSQRPQSMVGGFLQKLRAAYQQGWVPSEDVAQTIVDIVVDPDHNDTYKGRQLEDYFQSLDKSVPSHIGGLMLGIFRLHKRAGHYKGLSLDKMSEATWLKKVKDPRKGIQFCMWMANSVNLSAKEQGPNQLSWGKHLMYKFKAQAIGFAIAMGALFHHGQDAKGSNTLYLYDPSTGMQVSFHINGEAILDIPAEEILPPDAEMVWNRVKAQPYAFQVLDLYAEGNEEAIAEVVETLKVGPKPSRGKDPLRSILGGLKNLWNRHRKEAVATKAENAVETPPPARKATQQLLWLELLPSQEFIHLAVFPHDAWVSAHHVSLMVEGKIPSALKGKRLELQARELRYSLDLGVAALTIVLPPATHRLLEANGILPAERLWQLHVTVATLPGTVLERLERARKANELFAEDGSVPAGVEFIPQPVRTFQSVLGKTVPVENRREAAWNLVLRGQKPCVMVRLGSKLQQGKTQGKAAPVA